MQQYRPPFAATRTCGTINNRSQQHRDGACREYNTETRIQTNKKKKTFAHQRYEHECHCSADGSGCPKASADVGEEGVLPALHPVHVQSARGCGRSGASNKRAGGRKSALGTGCFVCVQLTPAGVKKDTVDRAKQLYGAGWCRPDACPETIQSQRRHQTNSGAQQVGRTSPYQPTQIMAKHSLKKLQKSRMQYEL